MLDIMSQAKKQPKMVQKFNAFFSALGPKREIVCVLSRSASCRRGGGGPRKRKKRLQRREDPRRRLLYVCMYVYVSSTYYYTRL